MKKLYNIVFIVGLTGFVLLPLIVFRYLYSDYLNNLWLIQYFGRYYKMYHEIPVVIDSPNIGIGMPNPRFYGYYYYQIMGIMAIIFGGARRALFVGLVTLLVSCECICLKVFKIFVGTKDYSISKVLPYILTVLLVCSPYFFTKLYEDGARGEVFGVLLLYIAIGAWILAIVENKYKYFYWTLTGLVVALLIGTHPITGEIGCVILGIIILITIPKWFIGAKDKSAIIAVAIILCVLVIVMSLPWLYTVLTADGLRITEGSKLLSVRLREDEKPFITRLIPFPFDIGSLIYGIGIICPYLTLQINVPMAIILWVSFVIVLFGKYRKSNKVIALLIIILHFAMYLASCSEKLLPITSKIFYSIQFSYRLITYVDFFALVGVILNICFVFLEKNKLHIKIITVVSIVAATMCFQNVIISYSYAYALRDRYVGDISSDYAPKSFYWHSDYGDSSIPVIDDQEVVVMEVNLDFIEGQISVGEQSFAISEEDLKQGPVLIKTNIVSSEYNQVELNGNALDKQSLYRYGADDYRYCFYIDKVGEYKLGYKVMVSQTYTFLKKISYIALLILVLCFIVSCVIVVKKKICNK